LAGEEGIFAIAVRDVRIEVIYDRQSLTARVEAACFVIGMRMGSALFFERRRHNALRSQRVSSCASKPIGDPGKKQENGPFMG
jgi:hypothetical protein